MEDFGDVMYYFDASFPKARSMRILDLAYGTGDLTFYSRDLIL